MEWNQDLGTQNFQRKRSQIWGELPKFTPYMLTPARKDFFQHYDKMMLNEALLGRSYCANIKNDPRISDPLLDVKFSKISPE